VLSQLGGEFKGLGGDAIDVHAPHV
jgi:hypothetical protein